MILILSTSLNPDSKSRLLAHEAARVLAAEGVAAEVLDLREHPLPLCDGGSAYADPEVGRVQARLAAADALIVATPIYNYDGSAALKNLIELTGSAWENKPVAFLCAAGGKSSYMSVMALANSLMLDFRCLIVPRFVYAEAEDFADDRVSNPEQVRRVEQLTRATVRLTKLPPA
ncbi:NADPH-dependent oxidoreductase [Oleiharenicola lentus]|jgi:FMN reductase|uniref:NADPH-dependent oxidoreductase n=1 Tax=Oleiharenicola lentus TaxID=2508720 RepID=A0A4Q1CCB5_9BACT|nr:NADPH-dependent FMN reductase [Oleiharenicola lentus]RXK56591.1 NADPH-dependent oxidoreductase [Oleiharenicola lentus]